MNNTRSFGDPRLLYLFVLLIMLGAALVIDRPAELEPEHSFAEEADEVPDFAGIEDVETRKQLFFDFLQPFINAENQTILAQRERLQEILVKIREGFPLERRERAFVSTISEEYEVDTVELNEEHLHQLLRRVDVIPSSLVLAQAANESAWGTSRFAVQGNNYFGQWCYREGCGIVPSRRGPDESHEVKAYESAAASVHDYFMNLNTFPSYQKLRRIRVQLRREGKDIDGLSLAEGLDSYSERGREYIEEVQSMINYNGLIERDQV